MTSRHLGHRAPLLWLVLPYGAGLAAGRLGGLGPLWLELASSAVAAGVAAWAAGRAPRVWAVAVVAAMLGAGAASYAAHRARLPAWEALPPREARVDLRVDNVFSPGRDARRSTGLATIVGTEAHLAELRGQRLYFSLTLRKDEAPPRRSAIVSAVGVLVTLPRAPPVDTFDGYLAGAGMNFRLTRGRLVATKAGPSPYFAFCQAAAAKFSALLSLGVEGKRPELAGVLRAMMLGQKHELSDEHDELFMRSGTMHLFAISGLHISVIALALHGLLAAARLPRLVRFALGLAALWLYVDITGRAPSAVRAFIMVALLESSYLLRVPGNPVSALTLSAGLVMLLWPMQIFSASFQMSYGIVAALLLLGVPLGEAWSERWQPFRELPPPLWRWWHRAADGARRWLLSALALGLAATLVSTLSGVLYFKLITPTSLLANLLLIPLSSLVILGGMASLLGGLVGATALSQLFNHAAVLVLWVIDGAVRGAVALPGAWHAARFASGGWAAAGFAALLAALLYGYRTRWRGHPGAWWPPFAAVAVTLILGVSFS